MATQRRTVDHLLDQIHPEIGNITHRRMFGECALYCDGKVVALICDDTLYVKPTAAGKTHLRAPDEAPPYPGAKNWYRIPPDRWEDNGWLSELIRLTAADLPPPKAKKPKRKKTRQPT